jgi:hypothetical protein
MYLPIPIPLMFLFLAIASFAPIASYWPGWWIAYYGALLMCWVVASVAGMRREAQEERKAKLELARRLRRFRDATTEAAKTDADAVYEASLDPPAVVWRRGRAIQCQPPR